MHWLAWFGTSRAVDAQHAELNSLRTEVKYLRDEQSRLIAILFGGQHGRD
jgi:hypothetical protein